MSVIVFSGGLFPANVTNGQCCVFVLHIVESMSVFVPLIGQTAVFALSERSCLCLTNRGWTLVKGRGR